MYYKDDIIAEVWRNRDAYARKHNYDLDTIVADLRKREQAHPERIVDLRHFPFPKEMPNDTTRRTFKATDSGNELHAYRNVDEMFKALDKC